MYVVGGNSTAGLQVHGMESLSSNFIESTDRASKVYSSLALENCTGKRASSNQDFG